MLIENLISGDSIVTYLHHPVVGVLIMQIPARRERCRVKSGHKVTCKIGSSLMNKAKDNADVASCGILAPRLIMLAIWTASFIFSIETEMSYDSPTPLYLLYPSLSHYHYDSPSIHLDD